MAEKTVASQAQPAQIVYVVLRYGNLYGVYASLKDAQDVQSLMVAKGQICDVSPQVVKQTNSFKSC